jgi:hypothetical protein
MEMCHIYLILGCIVCILANEESHIPMKCPSRVNAFMLSEE